MEKLQLSKDLLIKLIKTLPESNVLEDVRMQLKSALNKIEHIQSKSNKKQNTSFTPSDQWKFTVNQGLINPFTNIGTLQKIEKMIELEQEKLDELKKGQANDNDERMGTLLD